MTQQSEWEVFNEMDLPTAVVYGPQGETYNHAVFKGDTLVKVSEEFRGLPTDTDVRYLARFGLTLRIRKARKK